MKAAAAALVFRLSQDSTHWGHRAPHTPHRHTHPTDFSTPLVPTQWLQQPGFHGDCITSTVTCFGPEALSDLLDEHWKSFVTNVRWRRLRSRGDKSHQWAPGELWLPSLPPTKARMWWGTAPGSDVARCDVRARTKESQTTEQLYHCLICSRLRLCLKPTEQTILLVVSSSGNVSEWRADDCVKTDLLRPGSCPLTALSDYCTTWWRSINESHDLNGIYVNPQPPWIRKCCWNCEHWSDISCLQVKLVNIRNDDITDGNPKLTLGLIWTIILHFQVCVLVSSSSLFIHSVCVNLYSTTL